MKDPKSLVPFKKDLPDSIVTDLPTVDGHKLTPVQWLAFQFYIETTTMTECCRKLQDIGIDLNVRRLALWRKTDWWAELVEQAAGFHQENFYLKIFQDAHLCHAALVKIWKGDWEDQQTANAIVASLREINRMAKGNLDPIAQNRRDFNIKITKEEKISLEVIHKMLPLMTTEETEQFAKDGNVPKRLMDSDIIDVDPIEED